MAFIPPNFNIVLKKKLSHNNCSNYYKIYEYYYSCQDFSVVNFKQCCEVSIKDFFGNYINDKCYQNKNDSYFEIQCSHNITDNSYYETAIIIFISVLLFLVILLLVLLFKNNKISKKNYENIN